MDDHRVGWKICPEYARPSGRAPGDKRADDRIVRRTALYCKPDGTHPSYRDEDPTLRFLPDGIENTMLYSFTELNRILGSIWYNIISNGGHCFLSAGDAMSLNNLVLYVCQEIIGEESWITQSVVEGWLLMMRCSSVHPRSIRCGILQLMTGMGKWSSTMMTLPGIGILWDLIWSKYLTSKSVTFFKSL